MNDIIKINQIKLSLEQDENEFAAIAAAKLGIELCGINTIVILKKSLDARRREDIHYLYTLAADVKDEAHVYQKNASNSNISIAVEPCEKALVMGDIPLKHRPIVVGSGPCGLFCALVLAKNGYKPIVLERGKCVSERKADVENFWENKTLDKNSNVQFGEGGAGTFSDGKLNTLIKDKDGYSHFVLSEFAENGAPQEILYLNKPHLGTDNLCKIVENMRNKIIALGGEFFFNSTLTDIRKNEQGISSVCVNGAEFAQTDVLVIAVGHSARDSFEMLHKRGVLMEQKPFAIGVRIEHTQEMINKNQYKDKFDHPKLHAADYKLSYQTSKGRSVHSFCMCPGGVVVGTASEEKTVVTNGMSNYNRGMVNANSALVVNVPCGDFGSTHPLAGIELQRKWEKTAYIMGGSDYSAPVQLVGDFLAKRKSKKIGSIIPSIALGYKLCNLRDCLPKFVSESIAEALVEFDKKIRGFAQNDAVMTGIETRTSSPVRIVRNDDFVSNISGIYPAGEGAGYAGGIMSAAIDGIKVANKIMEKYKG